MRGMRLTMRSKASKTKLAPINPGTRAVRASFARTGAPSAHCDVGFSTSAELGEATMKESMRKGEGKIGVPILLWFLGVPGFVCLLLWMFVFR